MLYYITPNIIEMQEWIRIYMILIQANRESFSFKWIYQNGIQLLWKYSREVMG